ncbi:HNH endonuclease, partial [bacterium]|nr:HNH endonuclease [bacterium]
TVLQIDHINHDRKDNRIDNLRLTTQLENTRNRSINKNNTSGVVGVTWDPLNCMWRSAIGLKGKWKHLGRFKKKEDAVLARREAEQFYNYHTNHGKTAKELGA